MGFTKFCAALLKHPAAELQSIPRTVLEQVLRLPCLLPRLQAAPEPHPCRLPLRGSSRGLQLAGSQRISGALCSLRRAWRR